MLSKEIMIGTERRQFQRYSAPESAFAVLRAGCEKLGQIKNISKGGLAFEYISDQNHQTTLDCESIGEIDIIISANGSSLCGIPCKIIHDGDVVPDHSIITSVQMRRCGIQFKDLKEQIAGLSDSWLTRCEL